MILVCITQGGCYMSKTTTISTVKGQHPITVSWKCSVCGFDNCQPHYLTYAGSNKQSNLGTLPSKSAKESSSYNAAVLADINLAVKLSLLKKKSHGIDYRKFGLSCGCSKCGHHELWTKREETKPQFYIPVISLIVMIILFIVIVLAFNPHDIISLALVVASFFAQKKITKKYWSDATERDDREYFDALRKLPLESLHTVTD